MTLFGFEVDSKAVAAYEAELKANDAVEWLDDVSSWEELELDEETVEETAERDTETKITVRGRGKCHPAINHSRYGIMLVCSCPGSQSGTLVKSVRKVSDGWDRVDCRS